MTEITPNFIHDWKERHAAPLHKPPFIGGLRTGYLHAWAFVALKVLIIAAFFGGFNLISHIEENVGLLDQYVRNDFAVTENYRSVATNNKAERKEQSTPPYLENGDVASAFKSSFNSSAPTNSNTGTNPSGTVAGIADLNFEISRDLDDYIDKSVRNNLVNAIAARFILPGTGDNTDGCLQIDVNNLVTTKGLSCRTGGGGGGGGGVVSMSIGSSITSATAGSVLFAGAGGILEQDNSNFFWDDATDRLGIGDATPLAALTIGAGDAFQVDSTGAIAAATGVTSSGSITFSGLGGSGTRCVQVGNTGLLAVAAAACGIGGSATPWTSAIDADGFALQDALNLEFRTAAGSAPAGTVIALFADNSGDLTANVPTGKTFNIAVNNTDEYNFSSSTLDLNSKTITDGAWNGVVIGAQYGGTGINTAASTGVPSISSGTWSVNSQLPISLGGTGTTSLTDLITLGTHTAGNYVATISAGSGISGSSSTEGGAPTIALGSLTAEWNQTGAFDVTLNNAASELRVLESAGATFYGTLDVGDLAADATYTLSGTTGTIFTTANYSGTLNSVYLQRANNLSDLIDASTARTNLGLGTIATQNSNNVSITGGSITGITDLVVADGGTGASTFTSNGVLFGSGASAIGVTAAGTDGQCLIGNTGAAPSWSACGGGSPTLQNAYDATSGNTITTTSARNIAFTFAANTSLTLDAATTDTTQTNGVIDLDVDSLTNSASAIDLNFEGTGDTLSATQNGLNLVMVPSNATNARTYNGIKITNPDAGSIANIITGLNVDVTTSNSNDTTYAALFSGGNVGIGTTAPARRLDINSATGVNLRLTYDDDNGSATDYTDFSTDTNGQFYIAPSGGYANITGNLDITAALFAGTGDAFQVSTSGAVTAVGVNSGAGLLQGSLGLTITGAAVSLNNNSNFATNINTGSSNGAVTIGGNSNTIEINSSNWDVSTAGAISGLTGITLASGNFLQNGAGTFATGTGAVSLNGLTTVSKTISADSASTNSLFSAPLSTPVDTTGTNIHQAINIVATIGNATAGTNTTNLINIANLTGDAQVSLNALKIGDLTGTAGAEYALNVGSGWDDVLRVNGTQIINGTGVVQSAAISGTYSDALTLSSTSNALTGTIGQSTPLAGSFTTLSSTGVTTIGNNSATVAIDSSSWDISSAGVISGATGLTVAGTTNINATGASTTTIGNASAGAIALQSSSTINLTMGAASTWAAPSGTALALRITDGTNAYATLNTQATTSAVSAWTFAPGTAPSIASSATSAYNALTVTPGTYTFTGTTSTTSTGTASPLSVLFNQPTIAGNGTRSITETSNIVINGPTIASSSSGTGTITTAYGLNILAGSALNGTGGAVTTGVGLSVNAPTGATNNYAALFNGGNVGIGTTTPAQKLTLTNGSVLNNTTSAFTLTSLGGVDTTGDPTLKIKVQGKYLYVANSDVAGTCSGTTLTGCEFRIYDISVPSSPAAVSGIDFGSNIVSTFEVSGRYAYIALDANAGNEIRVYDISNPSSLSLVGGYDNSSGSGMDYGNSAISGKYLFIAGNVSADTCSGTTVTGCELSILDISNPAVPTPVGGYDASAWTADVTVNGRYAYMTFVNNGSDEFRVIDISNPSSPSAVGGVNLGTDGVGVKVSGKYAYVSNGNVAGTCSGTTLTGCEFRIYDISNPASIVAVNGIDNGGIYSGKLTLAGKYAIVANGYAAAGDEIRVYDVSTPSAITAAGGFDLGITDAGFWTVDALGKYIFIAGDSLTGNDVRVYDFIGLDTPAINTGVLTSNSINVTESVFAGTDLFVGRGMMVGQGGIYSGGPVSISDTLHVVSTAQTLVSAAGSEYTTGTFTAPTITFTGTTNVTSQMDSFLFNQPTFAGTAATVDNAATMTIAGAPVESGSVVLTNTYGLKINAGAVGSATTSYGLHVSAQTGAGTNYGAVFATGNVGISDTSPTNVLTVTGAASISSVLQVGQETVAAYSRLGAGTTGHSLGAADDLLISDDLEVDGESFFDGNVTITGAAATVSADLGDGAAGYVITLGRNTNVTNTGAGSINFQSKSGTAGYVWQDDAGQMRINTAAPTNANDTAGTVIGTQASVRSAKQDIHSYTDYAGALQMVADAPLHTFRYVKEVQGYGSDSLLAKERIGFMADEVPGEFMWGNSIDQVSVNGILLASVKELNNKINSLALANTNAITMAQPTLSDAPLVVNSHLYLSGDSIGQAEILEGDTSVRVIFDQPYQYQPIVTLTPNSRVGSEYWVDDKDLTGFTVYIDGEASRDVTFDWHAFAGPSPKLSVSESATGGSDDGTVAGDSTLPEENTPLEEDPAVEPTTLPETIPPEQ